MRIRVTRDGPYVLEGEIPMVRLEIATNEAGESVGWRETEDLGTREGAALCRCGGSCTKPFCDGAHLDNGFDGAETAGHDTYLEQSVSIDGPGVRLRDARRLCAEARFCDRGEGLWNLVERCDDPDARALAEEEAALCPSGRYTLCDAETDRTHEPELEPSVALVEDPHFGVAGPLYVRGGVPVVGSDERPYEVRNRVTLCRCGHSANKPFCDGSHIGAKFRDTE